MATHKNSRLISIKAELYDRLTKMKIIKEEPYGGVITRILDENERATTGIQEHKRESDQQ